MRPSLLATAVLAVSSLSACTTDFQSFDGAEPRLTPVQECAIGYDLAQQIYRHIELSETVIIAPSKQTSCETYALKYLQQAGFRIDDRETRGGFDVALSVVDDFAVRATATVGEAITIARTYELAETGVYAVSNISVMQLPSYAALK
ncbi:hypothetical protein [Marivivens donghaensis]|uniref:hypothetical protein n=1 Tax=Marivivens donghaensis TaxID=1699413 RepID=UPI003F695C70